MKVVVLIMALIIAAHVGVDARASVKANLESKQIEIDATKMDNSGCGCQPQPCECNDGKTLKDRQEEELKKMGPAPKVEDVIRPIDEWIKHFRLRTQTHGSLWEAASATVQPLLRKLKRSQESTMQRMDESNTSILQHVEEAATQHVYNLLRSQRILQDAEEDANQKKDALEEAMQRKNEQDFLVKDLENSSDKYKENLKANASTSTDKKLTKEIIDRINNILGNDKGKKDDKKDDDKKDDDKKDDDKKDDDKKEEKK